MVLRGMVVIVVAAAFAASAVAQQPRESARPQQPAVGQQQAGQQRGEMQQAGQQRGEMQQAGQQQVERRLVQLLIIGNQKEVAVSEFAKEKAKNDSVKEFAEEMVREHNQLLEKLQKLSPGERPGQRLAEGQQPETGRRQIPTTADIQARPRGQDPLLSVLKDGAERAIALTKEELGRHEGDKFDTAYMGEQVVVHINALAMMQAIEQHASGELQEVVSEAITKMESHLERAREVMKELDT